MMEGIGHCKEKNSAFIVRFTLQIPNTTQVCNFFAQHLIES